MFNFIFKRFYLFMRERENNQREEQREREKQSPCEQGAQAQGSIPGP